MERQAKTLEDELNTKQAELSGLRTTVAELTSSSAGIEAKLKSTQMQLDSARYHPYITYSLRKGKMSKKYPNNVHKLSINCPNSVQMKSFGSKKKSNYMQGLKSVSLAIF